MRMVEVHPGLFLGDKADAKSAYFSTTPPKKAIACMHEELPYNTPSQHWFPLGKLGFDPDDMDIYGVNFEQLLKACALIDECQANNQPVLVHCYAGVERSPLTVAYWLTTRGHFDTIDAAYEHLIKLRPIVQNRFGWLPEAERLRLVGVTGAEPGNNADSKG